MVCLLSCNHRKYGIIEFRHEKKRSQNNYIKPCVSWEIISLFIVTLSYLEACSLHWCFLLTDKAQHCIVPRINQGLISIKPDATLSEHPSTERTYTDVVNVESTLTISCEKGYVLSGSREIVCNENGRWNESIPTCTGNKAMTRKCYKHQSTINPWHQAFVLLSLWKEQHSRHLTPTVFYFHRGLVARLCCIQTTKAQTSGVAIVHAKRICVHIWTENMGWF